MKLRKIVLTKNKPIDSNDLINCKNEFSRCFDEFIEFVNKHRMYLTPLLPYGESSNISNTTYTIITFLNFEKEILSENTSKIKSTPIIENVFYDLELAHKEFQLLTNKILADLINGNKIF